MRSNSDSSVKSSSVSRRSFRIRRFIATQQGEPGMKNFDHVEEPAVDATLEVPKAPEA